MRRRRLSAVPIIVVVVLLLVGLIGTTLTAPAARPTPEVVVPAATSGAPRPTQTAMGRYPRTAEATIVGSCVSGIDPSAVPAPIAQAFCVCVLNGYEQLYPSYDEFQQATTAGTISDSLKTQISNRCVQVIVGG